ncbi:MAG: hypothetical protein IJS15_09830, partial [Victivallales bacterium]|nr:hypothetical protein [Victivallales bacterium]
FDPKNYTEEVLSSDRTRSSCLSIYYSEQNNWHLGTPERMKQIGKLVAKAKAMASTKLENDRVERFIRNVWAPAEVGRKEFEMHEIQRTKMLTKLSLPSHAFEFHGDLAKVDFSIGAKITNWHFAQGEKSETDAELRILADSDYIYLHFNEKSPLGFKHKDEDFWRNGLELFFADEAGLNYRQCFVDVNGRGELYENKFVDGAESFDSMDIKVAVKNELEAEHWSVRLAIPRASVTSKENGKSFRCNIIRARNFEGAKSYYFSPIFSVSHRDGLGMMAIVNTPITIDTTKERSIEEIAGFVGEPSNNGLHKDWVMSVSSPVEYKTTDDGHFILNNINNRLGFVNNRKSFPIAVGEKVEFEITGTCEGKAGCCLFMSNGSGSKPIGRTYMPMQATEKTGTQKVVIEVPKSLVGSVTHVKVGLFVSAGGKLDVSSLKVKIVK